MVNVGIRLITSQTTSRLSDAAGAAPVFESLGLRSAVGSKRFKNLDCAYCIERKSVAGDHVFAREFFLPADRGNLPQAPACEECNNKKSALEHYLTALLPFGGRHAQSSDNLNQLVPGRLRKNQKLHRELQSGQMRAALVENGSQVETTALPIREGAIEELFRYVARGLAWHHWGAYILPQTNIEAIALTPHGATLFDRHLFSLNSNNRVLVNLGNGTVIYEGMQGVDTPQISVWRFRMYGGMLLTEDGGVGSTEIGVLSGASGNLGRGSP